MTNAFSRQLYQFLTACSGNWRNTVHISCQEETDNSGYLLAAGNPAGSAVL